MIGMLIAPVLTTPSNAEPARETTSTSSSILAGPCNGNPSSLPRCKVVTGNEIGQGPTWFHGWRSSDFFGPPYWQLLEYTDTGLCVTVNETNPGFGSVESVRDDGSGLPAYSVKLYSGRRCYGYVGVIGGSQPARYSGAVYSFSKA
jgi:hypothetical protein